MRDVQDYVREQLKFPAFQKERDEIKLDYQLKKMIQAGKYDSFYIYDERKIVKQMETLQANFPQIQFLYSIKCNSNASVLECVFSHNFWADAASAGEVKLAHEAGLFREQIYYSAPGKTLRDLEYAIDKSVIIADSLDEIRRINAIAAEKNSIAEIGIRINPDFTFTSDDGMASKFGIDEEQAEAFIRENSCMHIKITGIHVHLKSQELNGEILMMYYQKMFGLAEKFYKLCGGLAYVNLGSGIGTDYTKDDAPLNLNRLGRTFSKALDRFRNNCPETKIFIETGRYITCKAGYYVTKVLDRKISHGKTYLILKNTLNGFLRPSMAQLVMSYAFASSPAGKEPIFTSANAFQFLTLKDDSTNIVPKERVTLVGNLCTSADVIAEDIMMPHLEAGDYVIITNAGSYGAVLSPMQFSSQEKPVELFLRKDGSVNINMCV